MKESASASLLRITRTGLLRQVAFLFLISTAAFAQEVENPAVDDAISVGRGSSAYTAFSITAGQMPRFVSRGHLVEVVVEVRNQSSIPWSPGQGVSLSYRWRTAGGERIPLPSPDFEVTEWVPAGGTVEIEVWIEPPDEVGLYRLQWDMWQAEIGWFSRWNRIPEPESWVLLVPPRGLLIASILPLLVAVSGIVMVWRVVRPGSSEWLVDGVAFADVAWCFASLVSKPYLLYEELSVAQFPVAGWLSTGHVAIVCLVLLFLPRRVRPVFSWLAVGLVSLAIWADLLHFRFFGDIISTPALLAIGQSGDLGDVVIELAEGRDWALFVDLLAAIPLVVMLLRMGFPATLRLPRIRQLATVTLAGVVATSIWVAWRTSDPDFGSTRGPKLKTVKSVGEYGLYGFRLQDLFYQARRHLSRRSITDEELTGILAWFEKRAGTYTPGPWFGAASGMNLLLIQVEAMQQFVVDYRFEGQEITPNLNRLKGSAVVFTAVQDQTGKGRSAAGEFVALTSIIPVAESVAYQFPSNEYVTPATVLRQRGYTTLASIPYRRSFWNRHLTHPAYGFDEGLYLEDFERGRRVGWGLNDREFLRQIVPHIEQMPRPFVVWLTTLSLHYPYSKFPGSLKSLSLGSLEGTALGNYLHGMNLFDRAFGELIESLRVAGLMEETVIALWGDHDSRLVTREQTIPGIELARSWPEWHLHDRVPFMVWVPGEEGPRGSYEIAAGQTDLTPTLLSLMGIDPSDYAFVGRDLLSEPTHRPIVHPGGTWTDGRNLWTTRSNRPAGRCWNLEKGWKVSRELCQPGLLEAAKQLEISDRLLLHDLQGRISSLLQIPR